MYYNNLCLCSDIFGCCSVFIACLTSRYFWNTMCVYWMHDIRYFGTPCVFTGCMTSGIFGTPCVFTGCMTSGIFGTTCIYLMHDIRYFGTSCIYWRYDYQVFWNTMFLRDISPSGVLEYHIIMFTRHHHQIFWNTVCLLGLIESDDHQIFWNTMYDQAK